MMILCDGCKQFIDLAEDKYISEFLLGDTRLFHTLSYDKCKQLFLERMKNEKDNGFKR